MAGPVALAPTAPSPPRRRPRAARAGRPHRRSAAGGARSGRAERPRLRVRVRRRNRRVAASTRRGLPLKLGRAGPSATSCRAGSEAFRLRGARRRGFPHNRITAARGPVTAVTTQAGRPAAHAAAPAGCPPGPRRRFPACARRRSAGRRQCRTPGPPRRAPRPPPHWPGLDCGGPGPDHVGRTLRRRPHTATAGRRIRSGRGGPSGPRSSRRVGPGVGGRDLGVVTTGSRVGSPSGPVSQP